MFVRTNDLKLPQNNNGNKINKVKYTVCLTSFKSLFLVLMLFSEEYKSFLFSSYSEQSFEIKQQEI